MTPDPINPTPNTPNTPNTSTTPTRFAFSLSTEKRNLYIGLAAVLAVIACCACGAISLLANGGGASSTPTNGVNVVATATATATTKPRPTATATPSNPNDPAIVSNYAAIFQADAQPLATDLTNAGNDCQAAANDASMVSACRSDMVSVKNDAQMFETDLSDITVPPCLSRVNTDINNALPLLVTGADDGIDGIDHNDASKLNQGAALFQQASNDVNQANAALGAAKCS